MHLIALLIFFVFLTASNAHAGPIRAYYDLVPETQALFLNGSAQDTSFPKENIKALIWNIKKTQMLSFDDEFKKYGTGKDLFLLQEAVPTPSFENLTNQIQDFFWALGAGFIMKKNQNLPTGTLLGSRVLPVEISVQHSGDVEPFSKTPKTMTIGKFSIEGQTDDLLVISIHSLNFTKFTAFKNQIQQAMAEISNHSGPVLFAGDFNTRNFERLHYLHEVLNEIGLKPVKFAGEELKLKFRGYPLDHAFVRGINVNNAKVFSSPGSDHNPLFLDFSVTD